MFKDIKKDLSDIENELLSKDIADINRNAIKMKELNKIIDLISEC